jgi:hypothetical protein
LHAVNAKEEITQRQRINAQRRISWNSASIADLAENIHGIEKPSKEDAQASSSNGRAPDSKSGCWGFKSLLACQLKRDKPPKVAAKDEISFADLTLVCTVLGA